MGRSLRRLIAAGLIAASLALLAGGCSKSEEDRVSQTVEDYYSAIANKDAVQFYELLTFRQRSDLYADYGWRFQREPRFAPGIPGWYDDYVIEEAPRVYPPDFRVVGVEKVAINGDMAYAFLDNDEGTEIVLKKVDGQWKIYEDNLLIDS